MSHFATAMSRLTSYLSACQSASSNVTHHTVIMGDFNLDWFDHQTLARMSSLLPEYRQLVTQITTDYASALDRVYRSIPADQIQCYVGESYFSDHKPVTVFIDIDQHRMISIIYLQQTICHFKQIFILCRQLFQCRNTDRCK